MIEEEDLLSEEQIEETQEEPEFSFATVDEVSANGVTLILDGTEESGGKVYQCNACAIFRPGDRVKVHKDSGTYVVEFPLGAPGSRSLPASSLQYTPTVGVEVVSGNTLQAISTTQINLGTAVRRFKNIYTKNGTLDFNANKIGFFGADPITKQTLSSSATLAQLITALKNYGLFT